MFCIRIFKLSGCCFCGKARRFGFRQRFILPLFFLLLAQSPLQAGDRVPTFLDENFSFMDYFAEKGWFDLNEKLWNVYGQSTYISSWKGALPAAYTNLNGSPNSLMPEAERSWTGSTTFYASLKAPWKGGEIYYAPEMITELPLSSLHGLGSTIQNAELQKNGTASARWYTSRFFLRQTFNIGGDHRDVAGGPLQLANTQDSRRVVVTVGTLSILDIFDNNTYADDPRQQFLNMAFIASSASDFAADARGYTVGAAAEYYHDDWAFRFGHFAPPKNPNDTPLDFRFLKYFGEQIEIEHDHVIAEQPGKVTLLSYLNREYMGKFTDAIAALRANPFKNASNCSGYNFGSSNLYAPDLCWARKANIKMGIGVNVEQALHRDVGVFLRAMYSDGNTEVDSYTSADRSVSFGTQIKGGLWNRNKDAIGVGYNIAWLSAAHVQYLAMGGVDDFLGGGAINYHPEQVVDIYYKINVVSSTWATLDYQRITNPGYDASLGPVDVYSLRAHFEY